jgi:hypothetical protein
MARTVKCALLELASIALVLGVVGACLFAPIRCDPSRDPELDKSLVNDPRSRDMDPATVKTISPPADRYLVRPSEVGY